MTTRNEVGGGLSSVWMIEAMQCHRLLDVEIPFVTRRSFLLISRCVLLDYSVDSVAGSTIGGR